MDFLVVFEFGDFGFYLVADGHNLGAFGLGDGSYRVQMGIVLEAFFIDVGDVHHRLDGE